MAECRDLVWDRSQSRRHLLARAMHSEHL